MHQPELGADPFSMVMEQIGHTPSFALIMTQRSPGFRPYFHDSL